MKLTVEEKANIIVVLRNFKGPVEKLVAIQSAIDGLNNEQTFSLPKEQIDIFVSEVKRLSQQGVIKADQKELLNAYIKCSQTNESVLPGVPDSSLKR